MLRGWALASLGQEEKGIAQMRQGLSAFRTTGAEFAQPFFLAQLAEVCGQAGQTEEGLTLLAGALALAENSGERFYEAELYRLRGELTLAQSSVQSLESGVPRKLNQKSQNRSWELGVRIWSPPFPNPQILNPKSQEAKPKRVSSKPLRLLASNKRNRSELRAATSLARLWQQQGKRAEAHKVLSVVPNWFTEGFDTKDLQEAKALLEELDGRE